MLTNALNTVGQYGMAGLGALGNAADLPGSSVRDLLAGRGLSGSFDQFSTPFSDGNRTSGRDLLRHYGMAGQDDTWGNFAGGLAVEAATDPLNLIGGGWLKQAAKARSAAMNANRGIDAANATSMAQRAAGFMPEETIQHIHKSLIGSDGMPKKILHGTSVAEDTTVLKPSYGSRHDYGTAVYGTLDPATADHYATGTRSFDDLMSATSKNTDNARHEVRYMDIRKPLNAETPLPEDMLQAANKAPGNYDWRDGVESARDGGYTPLDVLGGDDYASKWHRVARSAGYDGVIEPAGEFSQRQVAAFDPASVYLPYIAPALRDLQNVPAHATRTAAALAAHNTLKSLRKREH